MSDLPPSPDNERVRQQKAKVLFARILVACESGSDDGEKFSSLVEQFRKVLGYKPREFIEKGRFSSSSYYRWLKDELPPSHRIEALRVFLKEETAEERARDSIISGDRRLTFRPLEQLLDRQVRCKSCWVLKNMLPYRAAVPGMVQNILFPFLKQKKNIGFHCVFFGPDNRGDEFYSRYAALESFGEFKQNLLKYDHDAAFKLRGWRVSSEALAFDLGLTTGYVGTNILEYDREKTAGMPNLEGKEVDVLIEVPLAIYQADNHLQQRDGSESRWLELAPKMATWDWHTKRDVLNGFAAGKLPDGVTEFLATAEETLAFRPKIYS